MGKKHKTRLERVERTPESERDVNPALFDKSDADLRSIMLAMGACRHCAADAVAMLRAPPVMPPEPIRTPEGYYAGEPIGFRVCSQKCADAIMAALTMQHN